MASRLTYRNRVDDVAWQRQIRDSYLHEGTPPVPHLSVKSAVVRPIRYALAKQVILKYEWLGTMGKSNFHFGIFFGAYCAGVTCFIVGGAGAGVNVAAEWGLNQNELAYLVRGANCHWAPKGANSKLVSWSCRLLSAIRPEVRMAIAYADTDAGEIGTIYQAANWAYVGKGSSTQQWIAPNGRIYDQKFASNLAKRSGLPRKAFVLTLRAQGWTEQASNPKHRYVFVFDKSDSLISRVEGKRLPYPKRNAGVVQEVEHGSQPETALRCDPPAPDVSCGAPADTIDHKIPLSRGGTNDLENLQPMCGECNRRKRDTVKQ